MIAHDCDLFVRLLDGSFREYQRSAQRWWNAIAPAVPQGRPGVLRLVEHPLAREPARRLRARASRRDRRRSCAGATSRTSRPRYDEALADAATRPTRPNILYYSLRAFLHEPGAQGRMDSVQESDTRAGIRAIDVAGQDRRRRAGDRSRRSSASRTSIRACACPGIERLARATRVIINIDYPLGMAAYHHLSAIAHGVDELRGIYIMGKAATLNGRVGDVMISQGRPRRALDEHVPVPATRSPRADVQPFMRHGTVLDNQKALTVRSAFLQNREYMDVFYREGYTVMEMEAGPYLSAGYEIAEPRRHPNDEIVSLVDPDVVRARHHPLRVGYAVLAAPEPAVEEPVVLRHGEHVRLRDRDRAPDLRERDRAAASDRAMIDRRRPRHRRRRQRPRVRELVARAPARRARRRARSGRRDRRLLQDRRAGRLRLGLLGPLLPLQASRDRGVAARAHAGRRTSAPSSKQSFDPLRGPRDRLPVPEEHPPAAAGRVHRVPRRRCTSAPRAGDAPPRSRSARCSTRARRAASPRSSCIPYNEKLYATRPRHARQGRDGPVLPARRPRRHHRNMRPGAHNATATTRRSRIPRAARSST